MKFIHALRRAIFGARKVDSIVRQFDGMVADLSHTSRSLRIKATSNEAQARVLTTEADALRNEATRALVVANRISGLIAAS